MANANGTVAYTPAANYSGPDSFSYTIGDGHGGTATATVSVTVTPVNDGPAAVNDAASTAEDTAVTVAVLGNDTDPDGDGLTVTTVTSPARGGAIVNPDGTITFTPAANDSGAANFSYTVSDSQGASATATVIVTVDAVNDAPVAVNDAATTAEDSAVSIAVLANDTDLEDAELTVTGVSTPAHGSAVANPDGTITYTPAANYAGADSFTYTIGDGQGGSATATVSVTVTAVNDGPVAANDAATTAEDTAVGIAVLANDTDLDGDSLSVTGVGAALHGSAVANADGTDRLHAGGELRGRRQLHLHDRRRPGRQRDGDGERHRHRGQRRPDGGQRHGHDGRGHIRQHRRSWPTTRIPTATRSRSPASARPRTAPRWRTRTAPSRTHRRRTTPAPTASPTLIGDGQGGSATATVSITVTAANDAPAAADDTATTGEDTAVGIAVLANDTDLDGDSLTVTGVSAAAHGSAVANADGTIAYTPAANYTGADSFSYTIGDGHGGSATATVSVTVSPVNDGPAAVNDAATTAEDTAVSIAVLANDTDLDGDRLTITSVATAAARQRGGERGRDDQLHAGSQLQRRRQLHLHGRRRPRRQRDGHGECRHHGGRTTRLWRRRQLRDGRGHAARRSRAGVVGNDADVDGPGDRGRS